MVFESPGQDDLQVLDQTLDVFAKGRGLARGQFNGLGPILILEIVDHAPVRRGFPVPGKPVGNVADQGGLAGAVDTGDKNMIPRALHLKSEIDGLHRPGLTDDLVMRTRLRRLAALMEDSVSRIDLHPDVIHQAHIHLNRLTKAYEPALSLIELLMASTGLDLHDGMDKHALPGYLFDMMALAKRAMQAASPLAALQNSLFDYSYSDKSANNVVDRLAKYFRIDREVLSERYADYMNDVGLRRYLEESDNLSHMLMKTVNMIRDILIEAGK